MALAQRTLNDAIGFSRWRDARMPLGFKWDMEFGLITACSVLSKMTCVSQTFNSGSKLRRPVHFSGLPFALLVIVLLCSCGIPVERMRLTSVVLTTSAGGGLPKSSQKRFTQSERIVLFTTVEWADLGKSAGKHEVAWKWYRNEKLVTVVKKTYVFHKSPLALWNAIAGSSMGQGHSKVEMYVDDKLITTERFEVLE